MARVGWGLNLHMALCMTDELLAYHWGAAIPKMMRSPFPIGSNSVHATFQRLRSRATKAGGNVKRRTVSQKQRLWWKFCGGNPLQEFLPVQMLSEGCCHLLEILLRKSTSRISLVSTNRKFCGGNSQRDSS